MSFPVVDIKSHFPIFQHHPDLIYLDSAATSQKPQSVIDALTNFYEKENAPIHRGLYPLAAQATNRYEQVRKEVAAFIGASQPQSIAFTKGTTESINIVAQSFLKNKLQPGDNVVITHMEHHANLIPWQQICLLKNAELRIIPINEKGDLELEQIGTILDRKTKLIGVVHVSNTLGTINPLEKIIEFAHALQLPVLVDAAQSISHYPIDVTKLNPDFLVFSSHKMFGPMGTGVLYAQEKHWNEIHPLNYGGGAIKNVTLAETLHKEYPYNLEAGTPNVAGVIGLGAAINFIKKLDLNETSVYVEMLGSMLVEKLQNENGFHVLGSPDKRTGIISFYHKTIHPHDIASFLGNANIAVRAGHHCTQPLLNTMGISSTARASFSIYNTKEDVDKLINALRELKKFWVQ